MGKAFETWILSKTVKTLVKTDKKYGAVFVVNAENRKK